MNWSLRSFLVIFLEISLVLSAPTSNLTLFDAIASKCPKVKDISNFSKQPLFGTCSKWNEISKATDPTKIQLLCLMFHNAFIAYCSNAKTINTTVSPELFAKYNVEQICEKFRLVPYNPGFKSQDIIKTEADCKEICKDEFTNMPTPICAMSYHFMNLASNVTAKTEVPSDENSQNYAIQPNQDLSDGKKTETENEEIQGKAKNEAAPKVVSSPNVARTEQVAKQEQSQKQEEEKQLDGQQQEQPQKQEQAESKQQNQIGNPSEAKTEPKQETVKPIEKQPEVTENKPKITEVNADDKKNIKNNPETSDIIADNNNQLDDDNNFKEDIEAPPIKNAYANNEAGLPPDNPKPDKPEEEQDEFAEEETDIQNKNGNVKIQENSKPHTIDESVNFGAEMDSDSYFFSYFMVLCLLFIMGYVGYHNKQKILALILEGRRGRRQYRGRRPNSANYHKLDSNLEEAISSSCNKNNANVIY